MIFLDSKSQNEVYKNIIDSKRKTSMFSCGYYERYDPFLLEKKPFIRPVFENLFKRLFPEKTSSVLDIGCGTCFYWPILSRYCQRLEGLDSSREMINEAKKIIDYSKITNAHVRQGISESLPYSDESFDTVIAFDVLHHVSKLEGTLREIQRILKPKGKFFNLEPNMVNPIMFMAHMIPPEERKAIFCNWPLMLKRVFAMYFQDVELLFSNIVIGANSQFAIRMIGTMDMFLGCLPILESFAFRFILKGNKS
jgi:ubiquinone/menaquinone biosynthesis C-methylase UbiE